MFLDDIVNLMDIEEAKATKTRLDKKCWKNKHIGTPATKVKGNVRVNNCVPNESIEEAEKTDYQKRRDYEKAVDTGKKIPKPRQSKNDYFAKRAKEKRDLELFGEEHTPAPAELDRNKQSKSTGVYKKNKFNIKEDSWHGTSNAWNDGHDQWANEGVGPESNPMDSDSPIHGMSEDELHVGDPIVVDAPNEFDGKTGEIAEFSPSGAFVIVDLYNYGKHSMHLSDVKYNQFADDEDDLDEAEGTAEGLPHLTKELLTHIVQQVGTEGAHAIIKSLEWGDGAAEELLTLILKDLRGDLSDEEIAEHIGKVKGGFRLYSHKGKNLGTFPSKAGAEKHEREVQYFKHAGESINETESLSDIDVMRQDLERMKNGPFMTAYGMSKAAFQQKYRTLLNPAPQQDIPVNEGGWSDAIIAQRTGRPRTPYSVYIKGKKWKDFENEDHADAVANKLRAKFKEEGRDPSVITIAPTDYDKGVAEMDLYKQKHGIQIAEFAPSPERDDDEIPDQILTLANRWWNAGDKQPQITNVLRSLGWTISQTDNEDEDAVRMTHNDGTTYFISADNFDPEVFEDTGSWIVYDPETKQIKRRFKTHTAGKSYAKTHGLGFASSEYYFDHVKEKAVAESTNYWTKLQNERNTKLNTLVNELKEITK